MKSPITAAEIESTVKSLPNGKSPGPDGFTKVYYATFTPLLISPMCRHFNSLANGNIIPPEALVAHISVIPKEGKDPTVPQSYRPISLLNTDIEILRYWQKFWRIEWNISCLTSSILTKRASSMDVRWGIIPFGRFNWYIVLDIDRSCLLIWYYPQTWRKFDRIDWTYLDGVLETLGLGPNMLTWILALYSNPVHKLKSMVSSHLGPWSGLGRDRGAHCNLSFLH